MDKPKEEIVKFIPDYDVECSTCYQTPTVVPYGVGLGNSGMCGPCYFGTAEALYPEEWDKL